MQGVRDLEVKNFIGGCWEDGDGRAAEPVYDPATGEVVAETPLSTAEDINRAVKIAGDAFGPWAATPVVERARVLFRFKMLLEEHFEELGELITLENGKEAGDAAGERCLAGSVLVAVGDVAEPLVETIKEKAVGLKIGPGKDEDSELTPLIGASHRERVQQYIDLGEEEGAEVVLDGRKPPFEEGFFLGPTILDRVTGEMRVGREEIFGPVLSIVRARDLDEAIQFTNGSSFGNACSIFTESGASVRHFRENIGAGMLGVNVGVAAPMAFSPFNGIKESFGDLHVTGKDGVRFFTENKVEITRWFS